MRQLLAIVVLIAPLGCSKRSERSALDERLSELLRRHGATPAEVACQDVEEVDAFCEFRMPREQTNTLIGAFRLTPALKPSIYYAQEKCRTIPVFSDSSRIALYESARREPELRTPTGTAFEYLLLYQDLTSDSVCVQLAYADR